LFEPFVGSQTVSIGDTEKRKRLGKEMDKEPPIHLQPERGKSTKNILTLHA
jgi:hypothetical protein